MKSILKVIATVSVAAVLVKFFAAGTAISLFGQAITFGQVDGGTIAALLTPTLGAYVASLHDRFEDEDKDHVVKS